MPVRKEGLRELLEECHEAEASVYQVEGGRPYKSISKCLTQRQEDTCVGREDRDDYRRRGDCSRDARDRRSIRPREDCIRREIPSVHEKGEMRGESGERGAPPLATRDF